MWESENQDESPLMTTDNFHGIDRLAYPKGSGVGSSGHAAAHGPNPRVRRAGIEPDQSRVSGGA
jgi:hypothetical protein